MKQRKWRVLLSMVLAFCLCLSAVVPVSAAGVGGTDDGSGFGGRNWLSEMFGGWFGEEDEDQTQDDSLTTYDGSTDSFYRIFHLDCGRKYFSVSEIENIIDLLANNHYTHIELAFGNEGLRFVLDSDKMAVGSYTGEDVVSAIAYGNQQYDKDQTLKYTIDALTEADMEKIFQKANERGIGIIPMFDIPGHMNAVIYAMNKLGMSVGVFSAVGTTAPGNIGQSFDTTDTAAVAFSTALVEKYINYFAGKGCTMFNIAGDECGFAKMNADQYTAYAKLMNTLNAKVKAAGMTTLMFNDGVYYKNKTLKDDIDFDKDIVICYWTGGDNYATSPELAKNGFKLINTNVHWYYVAGNETSGSSAMFYYDYAIKNMASKKCTVCDGGSAVADYGCMLAFWCDNPTKSVNETNLKNYIAELAKQNRDKFDESTTPEPAISLTIGKTDLKPGESSTLTASEAIATWASDTIAVKVDVNPLDSTRKTALVTAISEGTATITATTSDNRTAEINVTVTNDGGSSGEIRKLDVNVNVGETYSDAEMLAGNYNGTYATGESGIATANAVSVYIPASSGNPVKQTTITSGQKYIIGDGSGNYLKRTNNTLTNTTDPDDATEWTITQSTNSGTNVWKIKDGNYYLSYYNNRWGLYLKTVDEQTSWLCDDNGIYYFKDQSYRIRRTSSGWTTSNGSNGSYGATYIKGTPSDGGYQTTVTFTGEGEGTTVATIGNVEYTINVTAPTIKETKTLNYNGSFMLPDGAILEEDGSNGIVTIGDGKVTAGDTDTEGVVVKVHTENKAGYITAHYVYTVKVSAIDFSNVADLPIQLWITNNGIQVDGKTQHTNNSFGNNRYAFYASIPAEVAYGGNGVAISEISDYLPKTIEGLKEWGNVYWDKVAQNSDKVTTPDGTTSMGNDSFSEEKRRETTFDLYKGMLHASGNYQVNLDSVNRTESGTEFNYVRYNGTNWEVSADQKNWTVLVDYSITTGTCTSANYSSTSTQIVAYYMMRTDVTKEVTTDVVDWGESTPNSNTKVILDYAVKYADGTQVPASTGFPVSGKTMYFNLLNSNDTYRRIYDIKALEEAGYEVYMITVTPSSDSKSGTISITSGTAPTYSYNGTEKVAWVDDEANLPAKFIDPSTHYTSISGKITYTVGGEPTIKGVEIYPSQAMLVTYYLRAKANNDTLHVHYIDKNANKEFYSYDINVNEGTFFDDVRLNNPWKGPLVNGTVTNDQNQDITVSADLSTMPKIGAQYRFGKYTCDYVEKSSNSKEVFLYYTFEYSETFVVDFGIPLTISPSMVSSELKNANITGVQVDSKSYYANITVDSQYNIIYTPTATIDGEDNIQVVYKGTNLSTEENGTATFTVRILPASNVYYEESFFKHDGKWSNTDTPIADAKQTTETLNNKVNNYGYDEAYATDANKEFSNGNALVAEVTVDMASKDRPTATFTFEGTGFDIVSECSNNTGMLFVRVMDANDNNRIVKQYLVDTYFKGDGKTLDNGTMTYQIPVVRCTDVLSYGKYNVRVQGTLFTESGAVSKGTVVANTLSMDEYYDDVASKIYAMLEEFGVTDEDMDTLEFVYMDENSVLNGGTGVATYSADSNVGLFSTNSIDTYANDQYCVYLDGFRVYNPLKFAGDDSTVVDGLTSDKYDDSESSLRYVPVYKLVSDTNSDDNNFVYIETDPQTKASTVRNWSDYRIKGPYNEIYLAPGQSIVLKFAGLKEDSIQISAKSVDGKPVKTNFTAEDKTILTCTEMYYTLKVDEDKYVTISNKGTSGVLSISEVKLPDGVATLAMDDNDKAVALELVKALYAAPVDPEPEESETFEPDYLNAYALPVAFRRLGATITVTSSVEDGMEVYIKAGADGKITKLDPTNTRMVRWGLTDKYLYTFNTGRISRGEYTYYVYAVMNGVMSEPIPVSFVVW